MGEKEKCGGVMDQWLGQRTRGRWIAVSILRPGITSITQKMPKLHEAPVGHGRELCCTLSPRLYITLLFPVASSISSATSKLPIKSGEPIHQ